MRFLLILALVLSQGRTPASAQSKGQPPKTQAASKERKPDTFARGSDARPVVVKVLDSPHRQADSAERANEGEAKSTTDWWLVFFTGLLTLVGAVQAWLFVWQLRLINRSLSDTKIAALAAQKAADQTEASVLLSKETAERQLRAYVFVERVAPPERTAPRVFYTVAFKNSGQTPAYDVVARANTAFGPARLIAPLVDTTTPRTLASKSILPAGVTHYLRVVPLDVSPEQIAAFDAGTHSIYIFGTIRYRDAFKKDRWSNFRYAVPKTFGEPEACEDGNEADQSEGAD